jgi:excinuclease ABC subunit C
MLELNGLLEFDPGRDAVFFAALPDGPGVLLLEMTDGAAQPYLGRTANLRRAAERLLSSSQTPSKRLNLRGVTARARYRATGSKFEQILTHYQQARGYFPERYRDVVRVRPAAVLKVNLPSEYPRCYVTRRIRGDGGFYFGPFASRKAADAFGEAFLDLFKIRRCQIKIRRDPGFPGCIYSEMKMCLAPCFAGCTREQYEAETERALETLETAGAALTESIEREREGASEALDFERAAALHKRLEKVSGVVRGLPELARRIGKLDAAILQRAAEEKTILVFPVRGGILAEPIFLRFAELSSEPKSVEAILRAGLEKPDKGGVSPIEPRRRMPPSGDQVPVSAHTAGRQADRFGLHLAPPELTEHLSLIARWYYSHPREGEIFFREADWPYRRMLRACARLLAPPAGAGNPSTAAESRTISRERIKRLKTFSQKGRGSRK